MNKTTTQEVINFYLVFLISLFIFIFNGLPGEEERRRDSDGVKLLLVGVAKKKCRRSIIDNRILVK